MAESYHRPLDADEKIRSALSVIEALLPLKIYLPMKRKFLSNCLWQITTAEGKTKYDLRYRSEASLESPSKKRIHEHVFRRKDLVNALLANPTGAREIVARAVGCVVTESEHALLAEVDRTYDGVDGWERYRLAGIVVQDMATGSPLQSPYPS